MAGSAVEMNQAALNQIVRTIRLAGGAFSPIFAHCNYPSLRDRLIQELQTACEANGAAPEGPWIMVDLEPQATSLFAPLWQEIGPEAQPAVAIVVGLEGVDRLDSLLAAANQMREEFRARVRCPTVFWVTDDVLRRLRRLASDFANWGTTVRFAIPTEDPIALIREWTDRLLGRIVVMGSGRLVSVEPAEARELQAARQVLLDRGLSLEPALESSLELALAQDESLTLAEAQPHYERSLAMALAAGDPIREGCAAFYYCLWWRRVAVDRRHEFSLAYRRARTLCEQAIAAFGRARRVDLVARFIGTFGAILRRLEQWEALIEMAQSSAKLHEQLGDRIRLAYDYGLLAAAELGRENWPSAKTYAEFALRVLPPAATTPAEPATMRMRSPHTPATAPDPWVYPDWQSAEAQAYDEPLRGYHRSFYLHCLGQALTHLGDSQAAIAAIEEARRIGHPRHEPELYISLLRDLHALYVDAGDYLRAYERKQERQEVEAQYRLRPFVGARSLRPVERPVNPVWDHSRDRRDQKPVLTTGWAADVKALRARLADNQYKLIVLHGESGVGKSSLLVAGLVPKLMAEPIGQYAVLPIALRNYVNWLPSLGALLTTALTHRGLNRFWLESETQPDLSSAPAILDCLKTNSDHNLLTVLIFDQFEEFFFVEEHRTNAGLRQNFYHFLGQCLNLFNVKIILSLREDYLHYLLELERQPSFAAIDCDLLRKDIRYALSEFSADRARDTIYELIEGSDFYLEADLIETLVEDLSDEVGQVRPIELQVIGAQLQEDRIVSLKDYRAIGPNPKQLLVGRSLAEVVTDCGPANEQIARLLLYSLTNENTIRPLKTRHELILDLQQLGLNPDLEALDLVLTVLVGSGLVFSIPDQPANRYQLVHDYLVSFVRDHEAEEVDRLLRELDHERTTRRQLEFDLSELQAEIAAARQERDRLKAEIDHLRKDLTN